MTDGTITDQQAPDETEEVAAFRARAREWIRGNLGPATPHLHMGLQTNFLSEEDELGAVENDRRLQRQLFDGGFAGLCVPVAYGGQGLTPAHQRAFNEELTGYEHPSRMQVPTFTPCLAVLLDFGTEEQKLRHVPAMLRGEELWMQLLSEPSGGSDVAAALTSAVRDGDEWLLNGSKVWTTGAWWSDWGLCLARTNWDVPKHRGLTVFMMPLHQDGVDVQRIEMINGSKEFCQEYLTDVRIPDTDRLGPVDDGWTVATRWMFHERMLYSSPLVTLPVGTIHGSNGVESLIDIARDAGRLEAPGVTEVLGEARMLDVARHELQRRILQGIATRQISDQSAAIVRLFGAMATTRMRTIGFELAGGIGAAWSEDDGSAGGAGIEFLMRQTACIGGGTTEMARNVISERVLGMPRDVTLDRDVPFREVPRGPSHGR